MFSSLTDPEIKSIVISGYIIGWLLAYALMRRWQREEAYDYGYWHVVGNFLASFGSWITCFIFLCGLIGRILSDNEPPSFL